jgi:hypothetical protein
MKANKMKFVRKAVKNPKLIVSKILALVKGHVALDRQAKLTICHSALHVRISPLPIQHILSSLRKF